MEQTLRAVATVLALLKTRLDLPWRGGQGWGPGKAGAEPAELNISEPHHRASSSRVGLRKVFSFRHHKNPIPTDNKKDFLRGRKKGKYLKHHSFPHTVVVFPLLLQVPRLEGLRLCQRYTEDTQTRADRCC